jgi:DNA mismatch repair protein MutH
MTNSDKHYTNIKELMDQAEVSVGKKLSDFVKESIKQDENKGQYGQLVEKYIFGIQTNNRPTPDIENLNVDIKVSAYVYKPSKKTYDIKERLVLSKINYLKEYELDFENSSFYKKDLNLLILFFEYKKNESSLEKIITSYDLYRLTDNQNDYEIVKHDWETIHNKIKNHKESTISQSDTLYLAACPKGSKDASLTISSDGISKVKARAYSYKASFVNTIYKEAISSKKFERIFNKNELAQYNFRDAIINKIKENGGFGVPLNILYERYNIDEEKVKNALPLLLSRLLNIEGSINQSEEFQKANIKLKTIKYDENGVVSQHMSFSAFSFKNNATENWEDSQPYEDFGETSYLFVTCSFKNGKEYLDKFVLWEMPESVLERYVKPVWEKTKKVLLEGNVLYGFGFYFDDKGLTAASKSKKKNNFPKVSQNNVCHVRPHAKNGADKDDLFIPEKRDSNITSYTKQGYWLDRRYITTIIKYDGDNEKINANYDFKNSL